MSLKFPKIERSRSNRLGREIVRRRKKKKKKKKKKPRYFQDTSSKSRKNVKLPKRPASSSSTKKKKVFKSPPPSRHFSEPDIGDTTVNINDLLYPEFEDDIGAEVDDVEVDDVDISLDSSGILNNNFFLTELNSSKEKVDEDEDFKRREIVVDGVPLKELQKKREREIGELNSYLVGLKEMKDPSGNKLLKYPENYDQIVNVLMHKPQMSDVQLQNYLDAGREENLDPFEPVNEESFKNDEKREMMKIRKLDLILEELECKVDEKLKNKRYKGIRVQLPPFTI